jgi:hypothetical protein
MMLLLLYCMRSNIVTIGRYVELAVQLLLKSRHMKWKEELQKKKLTHLAFDTVLDIQLHHHSIDLFSRATLPASLADVLAT